METRQPIRLTRIAAIILVGLLWLPTASQANAIVNAGFETGDFSGWTVDVAEADSLLFIGSRAHSGQNAAWFGSMGSFEDTLSQTFATAPEHGYNISFWLRHGSTNTVNEFTVTWDGVPILVLENARAFGYRQYSFHEFASSTSTVLTFSGSDLFDYYTLDDVSVVPNPEPATLLLLGGGLATMVGARRRRRNQ